MHISLVDWSYELLNRGNYLYILALIPLHLASSSHDLVNRHLNDKSKMFNNVHVRYAAAEGFQFQPTTGHWRDVDLCEYHYCWSPYKPVCSPHYPGKC